MPEKPLFDSFAESYERDLNHSLALSGEGAEYFADGRMKWLAGRLEVGSASAGNVLDFGCGNGGSVAAALKWLNPERYIGFDVSLECLQVASGRYSDPRVRFTNGSIPESVDLAFSNGVFHHIEPGSRQAALDQVWRALRPGGRFALFENSRWNPATRWVMSRCAFDREAVPLDAREARGRMRSAGFRILETRYLFVFPRSLKVLRRFEGMLSALPLGTQFVVWGQKP